MALSSAKIVIKGMQFQLDIKHFNWHPTKGTCILRFHFSTPEEAKQEKGNKFESLPLHLFVNYFLLSTKYIEMISFTYKNNEVEIRKKFKNTSTINLRLRLWFWKNIILSVENSNTHKDIFNLKLADLIFFSGFNFTTA